jgi:gliding motility-associated-like protein
MIKKRLLILGFLTTFTLIGQNCPVSLAFPINGNREVDLIPEFVLDISDSNINTVFLKIGTTPGSDNLYNESIAPINNQVRFTPCPGLPADKEFFISIGYFRIVPKTETFKTKAKDELPSCEETNLIFPLDGDNNVAVNTSINWACIPYASNYRILLYDNSKKDTISVNDVKLSSITPSDNLPYDSQIQVYITPINSSNQLGEECLIGQFNTAKKDFLPECTTMIYPQDNDTNVPLNPTLRWNPVPGAMGYQVFLGTSTDSFETLNGTFFPVPETPILRMDPGQDYFLKIIPVRINEQTEEIETNCLDPIIIKFTTGSDGCGSIEFMNQIIVLEKPSPNLPNLLTLCRNNSTLFAPDSSDGVRWKDEDGQILSDSKSFRIPKSGKYIYELYNFVELDSERYYECSASVDFEAILSEAPIIDEPKVNINDGFMDVEVIVQGEGNYLYQMIEKKNDNGNPPDRFENSNQFSSLPISTHIIYVKDKNGCGITQIEMNPYDYIIEFPAFFTPDGREPNNIWPCPDQDPCELIEYLQEISIFDRYGNMLYRIKGGNSGGWDGTFKGNQMPENDYWYMARTTNGEVLTGHFSLIR